MGSDFENEQELKDEIKARVQRGEAWLDANGPENWRNEVVINQLHMHNICLCVLGQVFGDGTSPVAGFARVIDELELNLLSHDETVELGFDAGLVDDYVVDWEYEELKQAWIEVLS